MMEVKDRIREVIDSLEKDNESYSLFLPKDDKAKIVQDLLEKKFPVASWGRIDWGSISKKSCRQWSSDDDLVKGFEDLCVEAGLTPDKWMLVLWTDLGKPTIKLKLETALKHAKVIFDADWDTWLMPEDGKWCIEVYHEGEICYGETHELGSKEGFEKRSN